jgi:hypothetical protein
MKRPNLQITDTEGECVETKGIENIFNEIRQNIPQILINTWFSRCSRLLALKTDNTKKEPSHILL